MPERSRIDGTRIVEVETIPIAEPECPASGWVIVRLRTEAGVEGIGECFAAGLNGSGAFAVKALLDRSLIPAIIGESVLEITWIWEKLYRLAGPAYDRRGLTVRALSGIDIACHDAAGKSLGTPVYQLLGGKVQSTIPLYASCIYVDPSVPNVATAEITHYLKQGFTSLKFYGWPGFGQDEERDIELLHRLRTVAGPTTDLMLDLGRPYSFSDALHLARLIERSNVTLTWWEEPVSTTDSISILRRLASRTEIPLAAGESEITAYAHRDLILSGSVSVIQPDLTLVGGLTEGRRICELGRLFNVRICPHNWGTIINFVASLQLLTAIPNSHSCEYPVTSRVISAERERKPSPMMTELASHKISIDSGCAVVPPSPGLGLELNAAALMRYQIE